MRNTRETGFTSATRFGLPLLLALTLSACGSDSNNNQNSSSSSSSSSSSFSGGIDNADNTGGITDAEWPEINVESTQPKQLRFSWTAVADAEYYQLLKNPDGNSGFDVIADNLTEPEAVDTIAVHQHDWHNAQYMVSACMNADCSEKQESAAQLTQSAMLDTIGFIKADSNETGDWLGWSLALSADGQTLAVGAPREASQAQGVNGDATDNSVFGAGAVYVFQLSDGLWQQEAYLKASNTESPSENDDGDDTTRYNDRFGFALSLSDNGNVLAVSAAQEDSDGTGINPAQDNNDAPSTGAVYLFKRGDEGWGQDAFIKASNAEPPEEEESEDTTGDEGTGDAAADEETDDETEVTLPTNANDRFGYRVALSGDGQTLAVSAIFESSSATGINGDESNNEAPGAGAVYVFTDSENGWSQQAYVKASNTFSGRTSNGTQLLHLFGSSLAISTDGNTLAVGATGDASRSTGINGEDDDRTIINAGAVYLFTRDGSDWSQSAYIKPSHTYTAQALSGYAQNFGASVALSGDASRLAVGSTGDLTAEPGIDSSPDNYDLEDTTTIATNSGAVYLFRLIDGEWQQTSFLKASNNLQALRFGEKLAFARDGQHLVVGSTREPSAETGINGVSDDNSAPRAGGAYLFSLIDGRWREQSYIKAANTETLDGFATGLGLSADGATLAIGAYREDSDATGINGDRNNNDARDAGAVYLY